MGRPPQYSTKDYNGDILQQYDHVIFPLAAGVLAEGIVQDDTGHNDYTAITVKSTRSDAVEIVPPYMCIKT